MSDNKTFLIGCSALRTLALTGFLLVSSAILVADEAAEKLEFPGGLEKVYVAFSDAVVGEDMPSFMKLFHRDFIHEALDGAAMDRGPWRRLWLDRLADRAYERMSFGLDELVEESDERVVLKVRRVAVFVRLDGTRALEETVFEDTWERSEGAWELMSRFESEALAQGELGGEAPVSASPRIQELEKALREKKPGAVEGFWQAAEKGGAPLVDALAESSTQHWVTFLWKGEGKETSVRVAVGLAPGGESKALAHILGTNIWYRSEKIPARARFGYVFHVENAVEVPALGGRLAETLAVKTRVVDPLNASTLGERSLFESPDAAEISCVRRVEGRASGSVKRETISSELLGERRFVTVYTPASYEQGDARYPAVFVIDSGDYESRRVTGTVIDNLAAEKRIPDAVVFMVHSEGSKREELEASSEFVRFLGEELLAWARETYRIEVLPARCVMGGNGLGATLALAAALRYPGAYGKVLLENGDFGACVAGSESLGSSHCLAREISLREKQPLRVFLSIGSLVDVAVLGASLHVRDVLDLKGYAPILRSVVSDQNTRSWQGTLAHGLTVLLGRE